MKNVGVQQLLDLVTIVSQADETQVPGFAVPQYLLETFQHPAGSQGIFDSELGVSVALKL